MTIKTAFWTIAFINMNVSILSSAPGVYFSWFAHYCVSSKCSIANPKINNTVLFSCCHLGEGTGEHCYISLYLPYRYKCMGVICTRFQLLRIGFQGLSRFFGGGGFFFLKFTVFSTFTLVSVA